MGSLRTEADGIKRLTLSTNIDEPFLQPILESWLERSRQIDGWRFSTYREPVKISALIGMFNVRFQLPIPPPFEATCTPTPVGAIDVAVTSPAFLRNNEPLDRAKFFALLSGLIGEEDINKRLAGVVTKRGTISDGATVITGSKQLRKDWRICKEKADAKLPSEPFHKMPPGTQFGLLGIDLRGADGRITLSTSISAPYEALLHQRTKFDSSCVSKLGERFAYLQWNNAEKHAEDMRWRTQFEESIDEVLRAAQVGCTVGAGAGRVYRIYIDMMLLDVDGAIPILRNIMSEFEEHEC